MARMVNASAVQCNICIHCTQSVDPRPIGVMNYGKSYFVSTASPDPMTKGPGDRPSSPISIVFAKRSDYHFRRIDSTAVPFGNCVTEFRFCVKLSSFYCYASSKERERGRKRGEKGLCVYDSAHTGGNNCFSSTPFAHCPTRDTCRAKTVSSFFRTFFSTTKQTQPSFTQKHEQNTKQKHDGHI